MKLNKRNAVWAFALAIAVTGSVTRMFAIAQCPVNGQNQTPIASSGILLFNGTGTTSADRAALENVITSNLGLDYDTVNSACLDAMSVANLAAYKLLIIPGGNSITIGNNISSGTTGATAHIKTAVRTNGLHYLGVCAGAFLASWAGSTGYNDIYLLDSDIWFDLYRESSCGANQTKLDSETLSLADGSLIDVYWEDGPQLTPQQGGPWGTVVAKYPNGQPAIIQGFAGNGWTLLQGVHPEAPRSWGCGTGCTCDFPHTTQAEDFAYSATLISAALKGTVLPHF